MNGRVWTSWLTIMLCALLFSEGASAQDFNGDGKADILWRQTSTAALSIWLMNGGTILASVGGYTVAKDWVVQAVGDFNGDGKADILWRQNSTGTTSIWLMNGGTILGYVSVAGP